MPGISFVYSSDRSLDRKNQAIVSALDSLLHFSSYKREILLTTPSYLLAYTGYKEYPIWSFEDEQFYICLEGKIYLEKLSSLNGELKELAMLLFEDPSKAKGRLAKRLLETNGEFILFVVKKNSKEIAILTDAIGHLPLYYCKLDGGFLLSREIRFVARLVENLKVDKVGLAQYLLFSYSLGQKSFLENIFCLDSSGVVKIQLESGEIEIKSFFEFNFEEKQYMHRTLPDNAKHLVEILIEGCKRVTQSMPDFVNVLGLSGGLDSRVVMLAMRKASVPFFAATRLDGEGLSVSDVDIAKELTKLYHLDWRLFELHPPKFKDAFQLLRMKNGFNYLGLSFMLPFLEGLRENYGQNMIYWTGDSGLVLRPEIPDLRLRNYDDLLDCILRNHKMFDLHDTAGLLKMNVKTLRDEIKHVLEGYPERSLAQKYVHFVIHGRTIKWHYEGMDRNRCYFWMSAPLEFTPFVNYAMNCPDSQKSDYRLYRAILEQMSPESCRVTNAQHGLAPASILFPMLLRMRSMIQKTPPSWRNFAKLLLRQNAQGVPADSLIPACIKQQMSDCPTISEYLSDSYIEELLPRCNKWQKKLLLTATSTMEDLTTSKSSLENFLENDL